MAQPNYIQKTLFMKPEVTKIFDDLDAWLDHCRFNLIKYDEKDLYRSREYKEFVRPQRNDRRPAKNRRFEKAE
jgi:hypothetical protein